MTATLLTKVSIAAIVLIVLLVIIRKDVSHHKTQLALFLLVYLADNMLIVLTNQYSHIQIIPSHTWEGFLVCNWSGKLYSIIFTLILLYFTRKILAWDETGLTLHQAKNSLLPSIIVILGLASWATLIGISSPKGIFDGVTLAYLAIMPGVNEELVYRGYLLGILNKVMPRKINLLGAGIGWGVILTTILFSLLHGFWFDNHLSIQIDRIAIINTFASGFIFAWLRERTGSLLLPVIAHGAEDFLFFLPRMV